MTRTSIFRIVLVALLSVSTFIGIGASEAQAAGGKRIVVDLSQQMLYAYSGNALVFSMSVNARGTRTGNFRVQNRIALAGSIYRGWQLPYWLGIYYVGRIQNGIHGPEVLRGGRTATTSLGCVVIRSRASAARLFAWAPVGTLVTVRR